MWTGAPQWQLEGLRRLEIPADMQRKHGFAPLGDATGAVKSAISAMNSARLYGIEPTAYDHAARAWTCARCASMRAANQ